MVGFSSSLNVPIRVDTDVNAAALGELRWRGHETRLSRSVQHLAFVTVATGVGVGIALDGVSVVGQTRQDLYACRITQPIRTRGTGTNPVNGRRPPKAEAACNLTASPLL